MEIVVEIIGGKGEEDDENGMRLGKCNRLTH